jgi:hypothetical protein
VLRDPVERPYSALGAAMIGGEAVGEPIGEQLGAERERTEPDLSAASAWSKLWARHDALVDLARQAGTGR